MTLYEDHVMFYTSMLMSHELNNEVMRNKNHEKICLLIIMAFWIILEV